MKHLWQVCKLLIVILSQCYAPLCCQFHRCSADPTTPRQHFLMGWNLKQALWDNTSDESSKAAVIHGNLGT